MLEKDPDVKRRFEEAAADELQQGWDRKTNRHRDEEKVREVVEGIKKREEERRENEVKQLLKGRVEVLETDGSPERSGEAANAGPVDVDGTLSKGYGKVRRD